MLKIMKKSQIRTIIREEIKKFNQKNTGKGDDKRIAMTDRDKLSDLLGDSPYGGGGGMPPPPPACSEWIDTCSPPQVSQKYSTVLQAIWSGCGNNTFFPSFKWYKNGVEIPNETNYTLGVVTSGDYQASVTTSTGACETSLSNTFTYGTNISTTS